MSSKRLTLPEPTWAIAGLLIAWGGLISQTRHHWGGESYYNFGWFVPPLAIWLLLRNLGNLTAPGIKTGPTQQATDKLSSPHLLLSLAILLPVILFHAFSEVNPFWRVPLWAQGVCMASFTLILLHRFHGWAGIRAGLFPLLFLSTMIPWPFRIELWIVQTLTGIVVDLAVHGLHFLSYPVEMAGNSLRLGDINIGVDEACSGIRSLQALFMVTLFLGSLFGQTSIRRLLAVLILPFVVILVNTGRAIFLSTQVIVNGQEAYDYWHDPAGYVAFGVSMILIYATIELLNLGGATDTQKSQAINFQSLKGQWSSRRASSLSIAYLLIPLGIFALVEGWFRYHESQATTRIGWEIKLPDEKDPGIVYWEINDRVQSALGYSFGHRFAKDISSRSFVDVYYYGYTRDNKLSSVSSYGHAPTICMEASGAELERELDPLLLSVDSLTIPFKHYIFQLPRSENTLQIFWTIWEGRNMDMNPEELQSLNYKTQWIQLSKGRRDFSRQVVLLSVAGIEDPDEARVAVENLLRSWITVHADS